MVRFKGDKEKADATYKGMGAQLGNDIIEVLLFSSHRRRNVWV